MNNLEKILIDIETTELRYNSERLIGYLVEAIAVAVDNKDLKHLKITHELLKQYGYYGEDYRNVDK